MADPALTEAGPMVALGVFEGPLDLLLHLVRENKVSIWDIPIASICNQYHEILHAAEDLDLEVAAEYVVCAAWLLAIKSRMLLPRHSPADEKDPRAELVERLLEYERVKRAAAELAGRDEVRRGMAPLRLLAPVTVPEDEMELEELDILSLAGAMAGVLERHRREHPPAIELPPMRFSVREKILELFELMRHARSFPLLTHLLTRPDRLESVTFLIAALELVRLGNAEVHQRAPFGEIYLTPTGTPLVTEHLVDA